MSKYYLKKMEDLDLVKDEGYMLDLGCGNGQDSEYFKDKGYDVTSVDIDSPYVSESIDIRDFYIEPNKYDVIFASNVLPFISNKKEVTKILDDMSNGLVKGGIMAFSVFGALDEWKNRADMSFWNEDEIHNAVSGLHLSLIETNTTLGWGSTMNGKIKYWHTSNFILKKG